MNHKPMPQSAHMHGWETFEAVFGTCLVVSLMLGFLVPLPLSRWVARPISILAGSLVFLAGTVIVILTRKQFNRSGQPTDPGSPTTRLITTGIFSWSRNPLYLGGVVCLLGLALMINSLWLVIFLNLGIAAAHFILILPEERYLAAKFGDEYRDYARRVDRWVGRR